MQLAAPARRAQQTMQTGVFREAKQWGRVPKVSRLNGLMAVAFFLHGYLWVTGQVKPMVITQPERLRTKNDNNPDR